MVEVDVLMVGFIGGFIGSGAIMATMWVTFKSQYKEYLFAKEGFKTRVTVLKMVDDIKNLKMQMASVNSTMYHQSIQEDYN